MPAAAVGHPGLRLEADPDASGLGPPLLRQGREDEITHGRDAGVARPILTGPELPIGEMYGYSAAGIIVALGLLLAGVRLPDKALRLAGLILLTATMVKVFLVDASELEGVLRILSFLGLGVVLIGIGRLYGPILRAEVGAGDPAKGQTNG